MSLYELLSNTVVRGNSVKVYVCTDSERLNLVANLEHVEDLEGYSEIEQYEDYTVKYIYCQDNALVIELTQI